MWPHTGSSEPPTLLKSNFEDVPNAHQKSGVTPVEGGTVDDPDAVWAARARDGDRAAMEILVERHQAGVARLLWRFVRTQADLDDLVQETFFRMVRGLPNWKAQQPFGHWLLRIATNTGRDYFRRQTVRRRWLVEPTASPHDASPLEAVDPAIDPAARAVANEVKAMLEQLPPDDRTLLTLHHLEGWGLAQIAGQFGWTLTATKLRAWRARHRLRSLLQSSSPT
jgi:RNA polymerase sigma-70 factor, ECF subfamily